MNAGARLDEIIHTVRPPADLAAKPYLQPVYDEPEFIVRNVWRLYGGNPAHLKPAPDAVLATALAELAGGAGAAAPPGRASPAGISGARLGQLRVLRRARFGPRRRRPGKRALMRHWNNAAPTPGSLGG